MSDLRNQLESMRDRGQITLARYLTELAKLDEEEARNGRQVCRRLPAERVTWCEIYRFARPHG